MTRPEAIGAFFDLDGTVFAPPSLEQRFIAYLDEIGELRAGNWLRHFAKEFPRNPLGAIIHNKHYLAGLPLSVVAGWEKGGSSRCLPLSHSASGPLPEAVCCMAWHVSRCHKIFLVSGTIGPLARVAARLLADKLQTAIGVSASELQLRNGHWTGERVGHLMTQEAKARAVLALAAHHKLIPGECYAYGDSFSDLAMLESVGRPAAVNPDFRLARIARRRKWQIFVWRHSRARGANLQFDLQSQEKPL